MKAQSFYALPRTPLATVAMSTDAIAALEQAANEKIAQEASDVGSIAPVVAHGLPSDLLFRGDIFSPTDVPPLFENPKNPRLGYRIVNVTSAIVPFGYNGTVVAIHGSSGFVEVLFDKEFAGGRPIAGANSKFKSALVPWAACLCTTTVDVGTGKVASRGHKHSNDQLARPAQPRPVMKPVPISNSPGIKSNKDIESLRSMLKRPVHTVTAAAAPVAMAAPIVPLQQGPITVSTKAPESLGGFRIIQRIGGDGGVSTEQKAPAPKKDKVVRKSDGTGFAALAAAATADVSDDDESNPAEEKRVAQLPKDCDVPEKKGDQKALRSLLSILQAGGGAINATAAAEDVPLISAAATESPTVELEETTADASAGAKKAPSKMVPPSVLLKKKKSSSNT